MGRGIVEAKRDSQSSICPSALGPKFQEPYEWSYLGYPGFDCLFITCYVHVLPSKTRRESDQVILPNGCKTNLAGFACVPHFLVEVEGIKSTDLEDCVKLSTSDFIQNLCGFWIKRVQTSELCHPAEDTSEKAVPDGVFQQLELWPHPRALVLKSSQESPPPILPPT